MKNIIEQKFVIFILVVSCLGLLSIFNGIGYTALFGPAPAGEPMVGASVLFPYQGGTGLSTYTTGDIIYSSATNVLSKLGIGSDGQVLSVSGGVPSWGAAGAGSVASNSLDFDEFVDAMTLDANTTITGGAFSLTFDSASVSNNFEIGGYASLSNAFYLEPLDEANAKGGLILGVHPTVDRTGKLDIRMPGGFLSASENVALNIRKKKSNGSYVVAAQLTTSAVSDVHIGKLDLYEGSLSSNTIATSITASGSSFFLGNVGIGKTIPTTPLDVSGIASVSSLYVRDGSATSPAILFSDDTNTGIYRANTDNLGISAGGAIRFQVASTRITANVDMQSDTSPGAFYIELSQGSAAAPTYSFTGDQDTGIYLANLAAGNVIGFTAGGSRIASASATRWEFTGGASVSGKFEAVGVASHSFTGTIEGPSDNTLSLGTVTKKLKEIISNIVRVATKLVLPSRTASNVNETGASAIDTASSSFNFHDGTAERIIPAKQCFTYYYETPNERKRTGMGKFFFDPFTITEIRSVASGSNANGWNLEHGGTDVFSTNKSASSSFIYTSFADATINNGVDLYYKVTSASAVNESHKLDICGYHNK